MCSIAGLISFDSSLSSEETQVALKKMMHALHHRGPDDRGVWTATAQTPEPLTVGLANTRLAIIDLTTAGHQPMFDEETGRCLTYNGECYNYQELRKALDSTSKWQSQTDTEVVAFTIRRKTSASRWRSR